MMEPIKSPRESAAAPVLAVFAAALAGCSERARIPARVLSDEVFADQRETMVREQIEARGVRDPAVHGAMRRVARHEFVPVERRAFAYENRALPIGEEQTISQPFIVAFMTDLLQIKPGQRMLEIGTGSGYQTAILAELADCVYSIERLPDLAKRARKVLDQLKYTNVVIRIGDGTAGWRDESPFAGIIVTAAAPGAPDPLMQQLEIGGKLVIPIGDEQFQDLLVYFKEGEDRYREQNLGGCRFVKLIGEHGWKT